MKKINFCISQTFVNEAFSSNEFKRIGPIDFLDVYYDTEKKDLIHNNIWFTRRHEWQIDEDDEIEETQAYYSLKKPNIKKIDDYTILEYEEKKSNYFNFHDDIPSDEDLNPIIFLQCRRYEFEGEFKFKIESLKINENNYYCIGTLIIENENDISKFKTSPLFQNIDFNASSKIIEYLKANNKELYEILIKNNLIIETKQFNYSTYDLLETDKEYEKYLKLTGLEKNKDLLNKISERSEKYHIPLHIKFRSLYEIGMCVEKE